MKTIPRNGPWVIINTAGQWEAASVPPRAFPTRLHQTFDSAITEALRLGSINHRCTFGVFECVGAIVPDDPEKAKKELAKKARKRKARAVRSLVTAESKLS